MSRWLNFLLVISIICIFFTRYFWVNTPEFWKYGKETGDLLTDLSIGFIAAFIFYIVDIWLPNKHRKEKIFKRIGRPINLLLLNMKEPIISVMKHKSKNKNEDKEFDSISYEKMSEYYKKLDVMNDVSPLLFFDINRKASFFEYFMHLINKCNKYIKQINELPNLDLELIVILDEIRNSKYHEMIESINGFQKSSKDIQMVGQAMVKETFEYYQLYFKLLEYVKSNKIEITIKELN